MNTLDNDEARALRERAERAEDKAIRFDLDAAGIEARERDAVELVELRAEVARLKVRAEKAEANYAFMVERAANERLDGYRELGARASAAENSADVLRSRLRTATQILIDEVGAEATHRYWNDVLPSVTDFHTAMQAAEQAEHMRLFRIRAIAEDASAPEDIRRVFQRILPHEEWHERVFGEMRGEHFDADLASAHGRGLASLQLLLA